MTPSARSTVVVESEWCGWTTRASWTVDGDDGLHQRGVLAVQPRGEGWAAPLSVHAEKGVAMLQVQGTCEARALLHALRALADEILGAEETAS